MRPERIVNGTVMHLDADDIRVLREALESFAWNHSKPLADSNRASGINAWLSESDITVEVVVRTEVQA